MMEVTEDKISFSQSMLLENKKTKGCRTCCHLFDGPCCGLGVIKRSICCIRNFKYWQSLKEVSDVH
jgi:hypothetical protein